MSIDREWRPIGGFADYEISNDGLVRCVTARTKRRAGQILRPQMRSDYHYYRLRRDGRHVGFWAHRLVAVAFIGEPPSPKHIVLHWNGNRRDNRASNLRWGTDAENWQDEVRLKGRASLPVPPALTGEANPAAKMNLNDVREIRARHALGMTTQSLSREFRLSDSAVRDIVHRRTWAFDKENCS